MANDMPVPLMTSHRENLKIAQQFREFRRKNEITQEELARLMDVTGRTIGNIERASNGISVTLMQKFRQAQRTVAENKKAGRMTRVPR